MCSPRTIGAGDAEKKRAWAIEEMKLTARAAKNLGVRVVNGFTGSSIWHLLYSFPSVPDDMIDDGYRRFLELWTPIFDVFDECDVKFALEVHPTEIDFDIVTAERALSVLDYRQTFGFNFDPSHLHWQIVDPVRFLREFSDRIYHVHMKDAALQLDGRTWHSRLAFEFRACRSRLGLSIARAWWRQLRGDHPQPESHRVPGPALC